MAAGLELTGGPRIVFRRGRTVDATTANPVSHDGAVTNVGSSPFLCEQILIVQAARSVPTEPNPPIRAETARAALVHP